MRTQSAWAPQLTAEAVVRRNFRHPIGVRRPRSCRGTARLLGRWLCLAHGFARRERRRTGDGEADTEHDGRDDVGPGEGKRPGCRHTVDRLRGSRLAARAATGGAEDIDGDRPLGTGRRLPWNARPGRGSSEDACPDRARLTSGTGRAGSTSRSRSTGRSRSTPSA